MKHSPYTNQHRSYGKSKAILFYNNCEPSQNNLFILFCNGSS